jgi:hypothetical protein
MSIKNIAKAIICVLAISATVNNSVFAANPASFTMSSSAVSVVSGDNVTVSIYENGDGVNVVTTKVTYDASKLQLVSSACGSSLPNFISETDGITCYGAGGASVSGTVLASSVVFKALTSSGTAAISVASGSKIVAAGVNTWNGLAPSVTISFSSPIPTPTPTTPVTPTPVQPTPVVKKTTAATSTNQSTTSSNTTSNTAAAAPVAKSKVLGVHNVRSYRPSAMPRAWRTVVDVTFYLSMTLAILAIVFVISITLLTNSKFAKQQRALRKYYKNLKKKTTKVLASKGQI